MKIIWSRIEIDGSFLFWTPYVFMMFSFRLLLLWVPFQLNVYGPIQPYHTSHFYGSPCQPGHGSEAAIQHLKDIADTFGSQWTVEHLLPGSTNRRNGPIWSGFQTSFQASNPKVPLGTAWCCRCFGDGFFPVSFSPWK